MSFSWNSVTDVAVVAYLGVSRWLAAESASAPSGQVADLTSYAGLAVTIMAGVWIASRLWEQSRARGESNKNKLAVDDGRLKALEKAENDARLELITRRAAVDLSLAHIGWQIESLTKRMDVYDSRERKNLRKLEHLETRMSPWLKEFEPEGTRSMAAAFTAIEGEEPTDDGRD